MTLRNKIILASWVVGFCTFCMFLIGVWAMDVNAKEDEDVTYEATQQEIYYCASPFVDYDAVNAMLDEITAQIPFIPISEHDRYVVECVVAGEAGGHSYPLMKAVAQCMAISMDMRGMTADEVRAEHKYSGYNPSLEQTDHYAWFLVQSAVSEIFDEGNFVVYEPIEYFYNPSYGGGDFHEKMDFIIEIDGVRFFRDVEVG